MIAVPKPETVVRALRRILKRHDCWSAYVKETGSRNRVPYILTKNGLRIRVEITSIVAPTDILGKKA